VGFCIGQVHRDATHEDVPDSRWFILANNRGLIPSGHTQGNPDPSLRSRSCPKDRPPPERVTVREATVDSTGRFVRLAAESPRAAFIGYALKRSDGRWHRISWDRGPEDTQPLDWALKIRTRPGTRVIAAGCIAVDVPSGAQARSRLRQGRVAPVPELDVDVKQPPPSSRATKVACSAAETTPR
jgi:hypothetical protein